MREAGGVAVRKTFHDGPLAVRAAQASEEFRRLERFSAALRTVRGAECAHPLELIADPPGVRMELSRGVDLFDYLGRRRIAVGERDHLAATIAAGVVAYVDALDEPLPDLKLANLLYAPEAGIVTFVDLGAPQDAGPRLPGASPFELTAGDLLGSVIFDSARPSCAFPRRRHTDAIALSTGVVKALPGCGAAPLREEQVARAARAAFARCALGRGARHDLWFATVGYLLARRIALGSVSAGPLTPWHATP